MSYPRFVSIQSKLRFAFFGLSLLVVVFTVVSYLTLDRTRKLYQQREELQAARINILQLKEREHYLFDLSSLPPEYFLDNAQFFEQYIEAPCLQVNEDFKTMERSSLLDQNLRLQLTTIHLLFDRYSRTLLRLNGLIKDRGFKDYGQEGYMRLFAHRIEEEAKFITEEEILMLRRHEKDFLMRGEVEYEEKFLGLVEKIRTHSLPPSDLHLLDEYQRAFLKLMALEREIGIDPSDGVQGELKELSHQLQDDFQEFAKLADQNFEAQFYRVQSVFFIAIGMAVLMGFVLSFLMARTLANPIRVMSERMRQLNMDGIRKNEQVHLTTNTRELNQLAGSFNNLVDLLSQQFQLIDEKNKELNAQNAQLTTSEQQLMASNALKDKFFSIIGHDLKGPIGNMQVFLENLRDGVDHFSKEELQLFATSMLESVNHLSELMENLLEWSRSHTGAITYRPELFDLASCAEFNLRLYQGKIQAKHIEVQQKLATKSEVFADRNMVDFVIRNLISNAVKFTPNNGEIKVSTFLEHNYLVFEIKDNGVGIRPEDQHKLFKPTEHFSTYGTNQEKGTGLGLILCKEFVERNRGQIFLDSALNQGTRIWFTLPVNR